MGSDQSKPAQQVENNNENNSESQDHYFVQELNKVSLINTKQVSYYWIDPRVYNAENQKYFNKFSQFFIMESFTSIEGLKSELDEIQNNQLIKVITAASLPDDDYRYLQNQKKIGQVFLFCGNEEKAKLLKSNFPKIKGFGLKHTQVIDVLKQAQKGDNLDIPPCNMLCMLEEDRKILNKYRLNYYCITASHNKSKAKQNFISLANHLAPQETQNINKFKNQYNIDLGQGQSYHQTLKWAFEDNFYFRLAQSLPKATTDPKKLAYLRLPFRDLWQAIFKKHKQMPKEPSQLYIVAQLNQLQISKILEDQTLGNFIIFTSFIKGYTKKADAIKQFKQSDTSFLFDVTFTKRPRETDLDFGYVISDDKSIKKNVIFNIYNFFQMQQFDMEKRIGTLIYGPLAESYRNRADQSTKKRNTQNQVTLLRNYDYLQHLIQKDNSQAIVLQMAGYFKEALQIYERKVEYLMKINAPLSVLNPYILLKGDAYRLNEDFDEAQKQYKSINDQYYKYVAMVHLLQLYIKKGDDRMTQIIQEQLQHSSNMRKLKEKFPDEYFKAENYFAMGLMKQNKFKQALKKFKNMQAETSVHYGYRFEGIPIVHDIFRNMATCEAKLNNLKQSLNLLNSTKVWQLVCEGQSAGLAITQSMIQSVYDSMGNQQSSKVSAQNLTLLRQQIPLSQKKYINQSSVSISMGLNNKQNVNNSVVNVNMNPPVNVNQSVVNVNINNPPINVNESLVNVNMNPAPVNVNSSLVFVDLTNEQKKNVNINNSIVDIPI